MQGTRVTLLLTVSSQCTCGMESIKGVLSNWSLTTAGLSMSDEIVPARIWEAADASLNTRLLFICMCVCMYVCMRVWFECIHLMKAKTNFCVRVCKIMYVCIIYVYIYVCICIYDALHENHDWESAEYTANINQVTTQKHSLGHRRDKRADSNILNVHRDSLTVHRHHTYAGASERAYL